MLFLHVGLHKTGTTSFQYSCIQNRHLLLEAGIEYPESWDLTLRTPNHLSLSYAFSRVPELVSGAQIDDMPVTILSSEELTNVIPRTEPAEVERVLEWLERRFDGLTIVVSVRSHEAMARAILRERAAFQGFTDFFTWLPEYEDNIRKLLDVTAKYPRRIVDIDEIGMAGSLPAFYIKRMTGKDVALPNYRLNKTDEKILKLYFSGAFRSFYAAYLDQGPYEEDVSRFLLEDVLPNLTLSSELEAFIAPRLEELFEKAILRFQRDGKGLSFKELVYKLS